MSSSAQVVVVTGGSRGLGLGLVRGLLSQGYRVATCSRTKNGLLEELIGETTPTRLFWKCCEVGKQEQETTFFDSATTWAGSDTLYGLINNSAIAVEGVLASFPNVDSERIININLLSALRLSRLALQVMLKEGKGGRIINISSVVGIRGYTGLAAYSASKAGLDGLTRSLAREVGRRNITVNSVAPGYFESALSAGLESAQKMQIVSRTPLGRLAKVEDITPLVRFLLSKEAGFITGQTIVVDGGITC
jgi:3-oxoacyl-[acyl-carrier protein] reductase